MCWAYRRNARSLWRRVRAGGKSHGGGRAAHHRQRPVRGHHGAGRPRRRRPGKTVGTVFVAMSTPERTVVRHMNCGSGRDRVRMLASHCAFDLLRRELEHLPIEGE